MAGFLYNVRTRVEIVQIVDQSWAGVVGDGIGTKGMGTSACGYLREMQQWADPLTAIPMHVNLSAGWWAAVTRQRRILLELDSFVQRFDHGPPDFLTSLEHAGHANGCMSTAAT